MRYPPLEATEMGSDNYCDAHFMKAFFNRWLVRMSSISDTSVWLKFFTEAGIPAGDATNYAITFTDNRIKMDMLLDLNREYLRDMGITVMGDIIAILKHAKVHSGQLSRQRVLQASSPATATKRDTVTKRDTATPPPSTKKSTPASRMLEHYVRKEAAPPSPPTNNSNLSQNLTSRLGSGTKRTLDDDDMGPASKRSSVFDRLGDNSVTSTTSDSPKITITMHGKDIIRTSSNDVGKKAVSGSPSVFGRLVYKDEGESKANSEEELSPGKPLEYQGILKYTSKENAEKASAVRKVTAVEGGESKTVRPKVDTMIADTTTGVKSRLGVLKSSTMSASAGIFARESIDAVRSIKSPPGKPGSPAVQVQDKPKALTNNKTSSVLSRTVTTSSNASQAASSSSPSTPVAGKKYVKKIVRVNKKTGEIVSEEKIPLKTDVFSRLGN